MFKVNEYKIVFKRVWHQPERHLATCMEEHRPCKCDKILKLNGRYDTVCEIWLEQGNVRMEVPRFTGIAKLHPNDKPDKIVGKKIALRNAIGVWDSVNEEWSYSCAEFFDKAVRTAIWRAFWVWVASWPVSINVELHNRAHGSTSVKAKVNEEMRRLHKTTEWQPPKVK